MQADDPKFWINTKNYTDIAVHNRLSATNYAALTVLYQLKLLPNELNGSESDVSGVSGTCTYIGTEGTGDDTVYIYRAMWEHAGIKARKYAMDFSCAAVGFGKRIEKEAAYY
jgi:hypothetical protein